MYTEIINKIKSKMMGELLPEQLIKLGEVLTEVFTEDNTSEKKYRDNNNLVKQFITAKKIEGCSKRTEEYYLSTLTYFEKSIKCDICQIDTNKIREYLINYQKINSCSNVTLDTVRRILSSFYKWLEEENFILKSPMKRIHRIKAPVVIKPALTDEQVQVLLGHTKIDTTLRYANVQQSNVRYSHQKYIC